MGVDPASVVPIVELVLLRILAPLGGVGSLACKVNGPGWIHRPLHGGRCASLIRGGAASLWRHVLVLEQQGGRCSSLALEERQDVEEGARGVRVTRQ